MNVYGQNFEILKFSAAPEKNFKSIFKFGGEIRRLWVRPLWFSALQLYWCFPIYGSLPWLLHTATFLHPITVHAQVHTRRCYWHQHCDHSAAIIWLLLEVLEMSFTYACTVVHGNNQYFMGPVVKKGTNYNHGQQFGMGSALIFDVYDYYSIVTWCVHTLMTKYTW